MKILLALSLLVGLVNSVMLFRARRRVEKQPVIFYDRGWFDAEDFERGIPTKEGMHVEPGDDIHRHVSSL